MALPSPLPRAWAVLRPAGVTWPTVLALAAFISYGNGFVLTSLEGAVGLPGRGQRPALHWFWTSTLMLPVFVLAVLAALAVARNRLGPALRAPRAVMAAALLIAAAGALVGTAHVATTLAYDYHLESVQLQSTAATHDHGSQPGQTVVPGACSGLCAAQQAQRAVVERAARLGSAGDLGLDVLVVGWLLAARGGRLETYRRARRLPTPA